MSACATLAEKAIAAMLVAIDAFGTEAPSPALTQLAEASAIEDTRTSGFARIATGFVLEPVEGALLLLLLAHATDETAARRIAAISPTSGSQGVPFWLVARLVPGLVPGHLAAGAALRRFGLVEIEERAVRVEGHIRLAEAVLDRLLGRPALPLDLRARVHAMAPGSGHSETAIRKDLEVAFKYRDGSGLSQAAIFEQAEPAAIGAALAELGLRPYRLHSGAIPVEALAIERLAMEWSREAMLDGAALIIEVEEADAARAADFASRVLGHVVLVGPVRAAAMLRSVRVVPALPVDPAALSGRWAVALGPERVGKLGRHLARIAVQFQLDAAEIEAVCAREAGAIDTAPSEEAAGALLWHAAGRAAQAIAVPGVTVIEPVCGWNDIVLAPPVERALRRLESHVRHATTVMDEWGFARRIGGRGRGVVALLSGPSGTGKTMAAEVLASSLDLRMMVIDLSQIISKWVGETSRNIAACFRHAERSGAVMVWNEGDAIWGARGAIGNATDRHVNSEIGDLLQRMESFNGFSVVTTNMRHAVDTAFLRRFRFMIDFPMPGEAERLLIWQQAFPKEAPVENLDWSALAGLPLTGGSIRNVALGSAFHCAERGGVIDARAIDAELVEELRKQDLPMPVLDWGTRQ